LVTGGGFNDVGDDGEASSSTNKHDVLASVSARRMMEPIDKGSGVGISRPRD
jgi:hypothetical protein